MSLSRAYYELQVPRLVKRLAKEIRSVLVLFFSYSQIVPSVIYAVEEILTSTPLAEYIILKCMLES